MRIKEAVVGALVSAFLLAAFGTGAQDAEEAARRQFQNGVELYEDGKLEQASVAFERAYELKPTYRILFNIAQVENDLGHFAAALRAYTIYLAEGGDEIDAERLAQVKSEIERLDSLVGMILVESEIEAAEVYVDDRREGGTPLDGPVFVDLGEHEVVIKRGVEVVHKERVRVAGGERVVVEVSVGEAGAEGAAPPADVTGEADEGADALPAADEPTRTWTWVAFGVGGAAALGAVITGSVATAKRKDVTGQCDGTDCDPSLRSEADQVESLSLATDVLVGMAAAAAVSGVILYFVEPDDAESEIAVAPTASANGGGLAVTGRF